MMTRRIAAPFALAILATACTRNAPADARATNDVAVAHAAPTAEDQVARGRYLVNTVGCGDCHTPLQMTPNGPRPDTARMLSGHPESLGVPTPPPLPEGPWVAAASGTMTAWSGPWGLSFTANLTPDPETGLGRWTAENFVATIRNARHMGIGRPLLPPMPAAYYANFTDDDLRAIFAYLRSVPAVRNRVPAPVPPTTAAAPSAAPAGNGGPTNG